MTASLIITYLPWLLLFNQGAALFSDQLVWNVQPELLNSIAKLHNKYCDQIKEMIDCDKAIIPIDLSSSGAIDALVQVLGTTSITCSSPDLAIGYFGKEVKLAGAWQLTKKAPSGVLYVRGLSIALQKQIADLLAPSTIVAVKMIAGRNCEGV